MRFKRIAQLIRAFIDTSVPFLLHGRPQVNNRRRPARRLNLQMNTAVMVKNLPDLQWQIDRVIQMRIVYASRADLQGRRPRPLRIQTDSVKCQMLRQHLPLEPFHHFDGCRPTFMIAAELVTKNDPFFRRNNVNVHKAPLE